LTSRLGELQKYYIYAMPIVYYKKIGNDASVGIWEITESESWFLERLDLIESEKTDLENIKGEGNRKQWLSARWLLHHMMGHTRREACLKDAFGKPHLADSDTEISISHSGTRSAVLKSRTPGGIDIQKRVDKIFRIENRFINDTEKNWIRKTHHSDDLHLIWGAKEALFKTYSRKKVDFRNDLTIEQPKHHLHRTIGIIEKKENKKYELHYTWLDDYLLVYTY